MRGEFLFLVLFPVLQKCLKQKHIQEYCVIVQEERRYETTFALQGPDVKTKQNPRLEGPHDNQEKRSRQIKPLTSQRVL